VNRINISSTPYVNQRFPASVSPMRRLCPADQAEISQLPDFRSSACRKKPRDSMETAFLTVDSTPFGHFTVSMSLPALWLRSHRQRQRPLP
jgi:hypothetical protein